MEWMYLKYVKIKWDIHYKEKKKLNNESQILRDKSQIPRDKSKELRRESQIIRNDRKTFRKNLLKSLLDLKNLEKNQKVLEKN